jgi:hypothetical protein
MIRAMIGLGLAGWIGYSLMPGPEHHQSRAATHARSDEDFPTFFKRFLAEQRTSPTRIESKITSDNRCMVPGVYVNGRGPFEMEVDSGSPDLWLPVSDLPALGISRSSLSFAPFPNTGWWRGNVAWTTVNEIRIGNFVARNIRTGISDSMPIRLFGMSVMKQGHMEVQGDMCSLTFPHNSE